MGVSRRNENEISLRAARNRSRALALLARPFSLIFPKNLFPSFPFFYHASRTFLPLAFLPRPIVAVRIPADRTTRTRGAPKLLALLTEREREREDERERERERETRA